MLAATSPGPASFLFAVFVDAVLSLLIYPRAERHGSRRPDRMGCADVPVRGDHDPAVLAPLAPLAADFGLLGAAVARRVFSRPGDDGILPVHRGPVGEREHGKHLLSAD